MRRRLYNFHEVYANKIVLLLLIHTCSEEILKIDFANRDANCLKFEMYQKLIRSVATKDDHVQSRTSPSENRNRSSKKKVR